MEIVLVLISPTVDVIRFKVDLEWPVRFSFLVSILIELGNLHNGSAADVVRDDSKVLSNGLTGTLIVWLTKNGRPSILEEVERLLAIEGEHGENVSGGHAISVKLNAVAWSSFFLVRSDFNCLRNAQNAFSSTSEDTSVGRIFVGNELDLGVGSDWMSHLQPSNRHAVTADVVGEIHIVVEEANELVTYEEILALVITQDVLPDDL